MTCEYEDSFMCLHFMNDPLFEMYDLSYSNKSDEKILIEEIKKQRKCVSNAEPKHDYLVMAKVQIKENSEITNYYDWHVSKQSNKRRTAIL